MLIVLNARYSTFIVRPKAWRLVETLQAQADRLPALMASCLSGWFWATAVHP
jgi:hypothetical protein